MIRNACEGDIPSLLRIGHAFYEYNPYKQYVSLVDTDLTHTLLDLMKNHILVVLEVDGEVRGAAAAMICPVYWNFAVTQGLELFWWVDPEYRKDGNAQALRSNLESLVRGTGCRFWNMVALESSQPEKVGKLYTQAGYELIEHTYMKVF